VSQVAVVTGATRGIGRACATLLADRGMRTVVNYRSSREEADAVVAAISAAGGEAWAAQADVTLPADVDRMFAEVRDRWGGVDVLVHNAPTPFAMGSFRDLTWEEFGGKLDREMRAAFLVTKAVVPDMVERGRGRLVYLSTGLSRRPRSGMIALGTAKAALNQFARYVAQELGPHGITANVVAPATVEETWSEEKLDPALLEQMAAATPLGRLARPADVARTVAFFAGDEADFTTGSYAPVNGGLAMD
jgi:NAD(P)-dependent dehydrogenase (short-subunit alcohol dehydrogenase family)